MISNCWTDEDLRFLAGMKIDGGEAIPDSRDTEPDRDVVYARLDEEMQKSERLRQQCHLLWMTCALSFGAMLWVFKQWLDGK